MLRYVLVIGLTLLGWPLPAEGAVGESAGPLPVMPGGVTKQAPDLSIEHTPLQCVVPTERPKIEAKALPGVNLGNGYVFYRATGTKSFYYVFLDRGVGDGMSGVFPRPEPTTKSIDYYLQALIRPSAPPTSTGSRRSGTSRGGSDPERREPFGPGLYGSSSRQCERAFPVGDEVGIGGFARFPTMSSEQGTERDPFALSPNYSLDKL